MTDISKLKPKPPSEALLKLLQDLSGAQKQAAAALGPAAPVPGAQGNPVGPQAAPVAPGLAQAFIGLGDYWDAGDGDDFDDYL